MSSRTRLLAVLWAAGGVSVACNVLAAEASLVGRMVAAWPPVALLLVVEVLARSTMPTGRVRWAAIGGAVLVAAVAAIASFHHMNTVALAAGESELVALLFPLSVDGLAVVASVALLGTEPTPEPTLAPEAVVPDLDDLVEPPMVAPGSSRSLPAPVRPQLRPLMVLGGGSPALNGSGAKPINPIQETS